MTPAQVFYISGAHRQRSQSQSTQGAEQGTVADLFQLASMTPR